MTGRLSANPPYRNPAAPGRPAQRSIRGHRARPDPYDVDVSPEKLSRPPRSKSTAPMQAISPLKKQKQAAVKTARLKDPAAAAFRTDDDIQTQVDAQLVGSLPRQVRHGESASSARQTKVVPGNPTREALRHNHSLRDLLANYGTDEVTNEDSEKDEALHARLSADYDNAAQLAQPTELRGLFKPGTIGALDEPETAVMDQDATQHRPQHETVHDIDNGAAALTAKRIVTAVEIPASEGRRVTRAQTAGTSSPQNVQQKPSARRQHTAVRKSKASHTVQETLAEAVDSRARSGEDAAFAAKPDRDGKPRKRKIAKATRRQSARQQDEQNATRVVPQEQRAEAGAEIEDRAQSRVRDAPHDDADVTGLEAPSRMPRHDGSPISHKRARDGEDELPAANESRKRRIRTIEADCPTPTDAQETNEADEVRMYGQWRHLRQVYRAINKIGVQHLSDEAQPRQRIRLRDDKVKTAMSSCNDILVKVINGEDPAVDLADVAEQIDALCRSTDHNELELDNVVRIKNIYFHLFPQLVRTLWHMVQCYEASDAGVELASPLTKGHLRLVRDAVKVILDLGEGARKYTRPDSRLCLVQPVNNGIVAPLKQVRAVFSRALAELEAAAEQKRRRQLVAEENALAAQQEEQEARQAEQVRRAKKKWDQLHFERLCAEGGILSKAKRDHLSCVPEPEQEYDQNGQPFERVQVFHERVGPSPAAVERARSLVWRLEQTNALADGLREYQGSDVFEKVFRRHCPRGQLLNQYNVVEIVTCAADLQEWLQRRQRELDGTAQEWVDRIPVWTRGTPAGKENETALAGSGITET
ncbi:hypothetical protein LTR53_003668 [Teratosphaeriaceae sp. CCFEE 6253]|nr:hypothetical protein LTR53_003668 [Teratosphaeriaceae sp. CCFEE 6253]